MSPTDSIEAHLASIAIHGDDELARVPDVVQPIGVSTTFLYDKNPQNLKTAKERANQPADSGQYYSRISQPVVRNAEKVIGDITGGHAVLFNSGLSAFLAAMLYFNPKRVFANDCYFGCHGVLKLLKRNYGVETYGLDKIEELAEKGDVIHVESPINPTGVAFDFEKYVLLGHSKGAYVMVDSTFAPPPLQDPFKFGVDLVMHSATKYFGGHSDLLAGVIITKDESVKKDILQDRGYTGAIPGSLEAWLLTRSLRTLNMRVRTQAASANAIVKYLSENIDKLPKLAKVYHSSLQTEEFVKKQLPLGGGPVFSIEVVDKETARQLPSRLKLFAHATSLGGVESLIEWRAISDERCSETLLRVSIGVEDQEDLLQDLVQALS
ncbi:cystathionine gamma-lyase [Trichomonascus vanleenenianus]|uniref:cystathionine gamma-lyase n=1 Tax=Trichomonascus vanleenenianus TaxID=2268995 RepID=UPI003ECB6C6E